MLVTSGLGKFTGSGAPLDGLVSAPLSAVKAAPLLVTPAKALPQVVSQDISSRGVTTAYVVGGVTAVSAAVPSRKVPEAGREAMATPTCLPPGRVSTPS